MNIIQSIILGIIQGLTEFLPISSSGHLVIVPILLKWDIPPQEAFLFDVLVQVATLTAVLAYFWQDLLEILKSMLRAIKARTPFSIPEARLGWFILLATVPAGAFGILLRDTVEMAFASLTATGVALLLTAGLLTLGEIIGKRFRTLEHITWFDAILIGTFQVFAMFPGVSRSGSTMTGGLIRDLDRPSAARFSFLMSIPVMLAAGLLAGIDLISFNNSSIQFLVFIPGFVSAAFVGYLAIRWLIRYLQSHSFYIFAIYCAVLGTISIILSLTIY